MAWKKGESGNPGGRPKAMKLVEAKAREHTPLAMKTLADICGDPEAPPAARVSAATVILDRGWGKPRQEHDHTINAPAGVASDADLLAIALGGSGDPVEEAAGQGEPGGVVH